MDKSGRKNVWTLVNLGLGVVLALAVVGDLLWLSDNAPHAWVLLTATGVATGVLALARDRGRTRTAVAGVVVTGAAAVVAVATGQPTQPTIAPTIALLVLGAACVRTESVRSSLIVAVAGAVVLLAGHLTTPSYVASLVSLDALLWGAALGAGLWLRTLDARRRDAIAAVRREERLDMARELHDVVAHHVTGMILQAQAAQLVAGERPEAAQPALAVIESAGTEALAAMRRVVEVLRSDDDAAERRPGPEQLGDLVQRFAATGPSVTLRLPDGPKAADWTPEVATAVYRIVQEALTNVARHAPDARHVSVAVEERPATLTVEVTDDAPGEPPRSTAGGGHGLLGMRERVEALGGTLDAGPVPSGGWAVSATLPKGSRGAA